MFLVESWAVPCPESNCAPPCSEVNVCSCCYKKILSHVRAVLLFSRLQLDDVLVKAHQIKVKCKVLPKRREL